MEYFKNRVVLGAVPQMDVIAEYSGLVAASSLVKSPTITASASFSNGLDGFDLNEANYARVSTDDDPAWIKIDYGELFYIHTITMRGGPDASGSHVCTLDVSQDDSNWTTVDTWSSQTYYNEMSPEFFVNRSVRYIRFSRTESNYLRLYAMGVTYRV